MPKSGIRAKNEAVKVSYALFCTSKLRAIRKCWVSFRLRINLTVNNLGGQRTAGH